MEQGLITSGDDLKHIARFLPAGKSSYHAEDVIGKLLENVPQILADERLMSTQQLQLAISPAQADPNSRDSNVSLAVLL